MLQIRRKDNGFYSTGGRYPSFRKTGKIWKTWGQVKNHLNIANYRDAHELEVVELEVREKSTYPLSKLIAVQAQEKAVKAEARAKSHQRGVKARELKQLRELAKKHGMALGSKREYKLTTGPSLNWEPCGVVGCRRMTNKVNDNYCYSCKSVIAWGEAQK